MTIAVFRRERLVWSTYCIVLNIVAKNFRWSPIQELATPASAYCQSDFSTESLGHTGSHIEFCLINLHIYICV